MHSSTMQGSSAQQHTARQQLKTSSWYKTAQHHTGYITVTVMALLWLLQATHCAPWDLRTSMAAAPDLNPMHKSLAPRGSHPHKSAGIDLVTHCAPRDSRRSMAGSCPQAQASDRGVWPCVSCWDRLAPAAANRLMTSR